MDGQHMAKHRARTYRCRTAIGATATVAAAGAVVLASVGTAHADGSGISWDSIANCESSGNWHINTNNGFLGGLQWSPATWAANGGVGNAANASREAQIAVAEHLIAVQGVARGLANWPVCGKRAWSGPASVLTVSKTVIPAKPRPVQAASPAPAGTTATVTVQLGDTLGVIAATHGTTWQQLQTLNGIQDADLIYPGQVLKVA